MSSETKTETGVQYCYSMTILGWRTVVYKKLETAYALVEECMEKFGTIPEKSLDQVREELTKNRICIVNELRLKGMFAGLSFGTVVTFEQFEFIDWKED